jgi:signal transduction histidine kinase
VTWEWLHGQRLLAVLAMSCFALVAAGLAATIGLDLAVVGEQLPADVPPYNWPSAAAGMAVAIPAILVLRRRHRSPVGWILLVGGLLLVVTASAASYATWGVFARRGEVPGISAAVVLDARFEAATVLVLPLMLLYFPDGRLPSRGWRMPAMLTLGGAVIAVLMSATVPLHLVLEGDDSLPRAFRGLRLDPFSIAAPDPVWRALLQLLAPLSALVVLIPLAAYLARFRGADPTRRAQLRWLLLAAVLALVAQLLVGLAEPPRIVAELVLVLTHAALALAVLVAITRHHLYDIDVLLGATLVYGSLVALLVTLDLAIATEVGRALHGRHDTAAAVLATTAVLSLYGPLRARLATAADRLVHGRRSDRYGVVRDLAERLEGSVRPDDLLGEVAVAVANAFRARYVRVELDGHNGRRTVVERGDPAPVTQQLTLRYRGNAVGRMALSQPAGRLAGQDARLLADLVRQAGVAAHAVMLNEELSASREQLVTSREEERRRLRRDLHDGLGPALGAVTLKVETARMLMRSAPDDADGVLVGVTEDIAATLADIRRLVHGLRPPALDEVGLAGALRQQAERLSAAPTGSPAPSLHIEVDIDGGGGADPLPAAVEVAAYRIASEAMLNVRRHAHATTCSVGVREEDGSLVLEVRDDGVGMTDNATAGVGLVSVRERVAELGGTWSVSSQDGHGTLLRATLPIQPLPESRAAHVSPAEAPPHLPGARPADLMSMP